MNIMAEIDLNGEGLTIGKDGILTSHISGHKAITAAEAIKRSATARTLAAQYIEAAENMERLAEDALSC